MRNASLRLYVKGQILWNTLKDENGQDLVEYAALTTVIVLGLVTGMQSLATGINTAMVAVGSNIAAKLAAIT